MIVRAYSIFDSKVGAFGPPFYAVNSVSLLRDVSRLLLSNPKHDYVVFSNDYIIYEIGSYDDSLGDLSSVPKTLVASMSEVVQSLPKEGGSL